MARFRANILSRIAVRAAYAIGDKPPKTRPRVCRLDLAARTACLRIDEALPHEGGRRAHLLPLTQHRSLKSRLDDRRHDSTPDANRTRTCKTCGPRVRWRTRNGATKKRTPLHLSAGDAHTTARLGCGPTLLVVLLSHRRNPSFAALRGANPRHFSQQLEVDPLSACSQRELDCGAKQIAYLPEKTFTELQD